MTQLERKCLLASTSAHAALALLLFVAPVIWVAQKRPEISLPTLTFIPSRLVDGAMSGGGSPTAKSMPPPAAGPAKTPLVMAPPAPAPAAPKPQPSAPPREKPVKVEEQPPPKPRRATGDIVPSDKKTEESTDSNDAKPSRHKVQVSFTRETSHPKDSKDSTATDSHAAGVAQARAAQARFASGVNNVLAALAQGVSSGTSVEVPGPGGEATANYGQWVVAVYHRAWSPPSDLADELATVTVQVVILRNGKVDSFKVIKRTGNTALDRSVERLRNVPSIAPFPDGATEDRRTFIIDFNLRSKNS